MCLLVVNQKHQMRLHVGAMASGGRLIVCGHMLLLCTAPIDPSLEAGQTPRLLGSGTWLLGRRQVRSAL